VSESLDLLLSEQCGLITPAQAATFGPSRKAVQHRVLAGKWQRVHPGVYGTWTGTLDAEQRIWAASLYAGEDAVVSHQSAVWLADRDSEAPKVVHIAVPVDRKVVRQSGLVIVRTRRMYEQDIQPGSRPRRFRAERAVLDSAAAAPDDRRAVALIASAVQRRVTTAGRLACAMARCPNNLPRRALLERVLVLAGDGAHSLIEVLHHDACSSHGLPSPHRQRRIGSSVADAAYDMPAGTLLAEFDGRLAHLQAVSWWADMHRDNRHSNQGLATLRFPGFILLTDPHLVAETIAVGLTRLGWPGQLRCPRGCPGLRAIRAPVGA
jgi:hypothetical protein